MANYIATTEQFTATANAIRAKTGSSGSLEWDANTGYADDIAAIPTGDDTSDANATAADILSGKTAYVKGSKVTGNIAFQPAQTITPGTTNQTIASGKYLTGVQTIKGDANLVASNIAEGVSIFGVTGTHAGGGEHDLEDAFITKTVSGAYENSRVTMIGRYTFDSCYDLISVNFPNCTEIGNGAFANCAHLTTVNLPICSIMSNNTFAGCYSLTTIDLPRCANIGSNAFANCTHLTTASFPSCTVISSSAFNHCHMLLSLYLLKSSVARLVHRNIFPATPIANSTASTGGVNGSIFVRASLLTTWTTTTNWTYYSSRFVGLTDEQIAALG